MREAGRGMRFVPLPMNIEELQSRGKAEHPIETLLIVCLRQCAGNRTTLCLRTPS